MNTQPATCTAVFVSGEQNKPGIKKNEYPAHSPYRRVFLTGYSTMTPNEVFETALIIAAKAHRSQTDKAGNPYILHPLHLAAQFPDNLKLATIALLHDVIEDSEHCGASLLAAGIPKGIVLAVEVLTHRKSDTYSQYIHRVAGYTDARQVKMEDLKHNMQVLRLKGVMTQKDLERIQKYHSAYRYLEGAP